MAPSRDHHRCMVRSHSASGHSHRRGGPRRTGASITTWCALTTHAGWTGSIQAQRPSALRVAPDRISAGQVERYIDLRPGVGVVVQQHAIGRCAMAMKVEIEREMVKVHAPAGSLQSPMQVGQIKRLGNVVGQFIGEMQRHGRTARWHGSAAQAPIVIA